MAAAACPSSRYTARVDLLAEVVSVYTTVCLSLSPRLPSRRTNMVMNYSEVESKVREATNDETWGPHGTLMSEIAKYTFTYEHYPEVMTMLWRRMFEARRNWRRTYKVSGTAGREGRGCGCGGI